MPDTTDHQLDCTIDPRSFSMMKSTYLVASWQSRHCFLYRAGLFSTKYYFLCTHQQMFFNIYLSQWVPSGEAFRICDLTRLESETLPLYFRHSRFQSLVRQLNFYNFRKINRERTFWVYYHPLFHRDTPDEMHKLRRRTCPGYDGRRNNRQDSTSMPPPPSSKIDWGTEEEMRQHQVEGKGKAESNNTRVRSRSTSPKPGNKVSRSPSPSSSPMDMIPAGRGHFHSSTTFTSISEEERGPNQSAMSNPSRRLSPFASSSDNGIAFGQNTNSQHPNANEYNWQASNPPADFVDNELNRNLGAPGFSEFAPITKKQRKAKLTIWSDNENDTDSSTRKKKQELQDRQNHLLTVADVSRHLDGICSDYVASISGRKARKLSRNRSLGGNNPGQAVRHPSEWPMFGLGKPHDHYYGPGKCDLFTYDCGDGFVIDEQDDGSSSKEKKATIVTPTKIHKKPVVTSPPCHCPIVNNSIVQACIEGKLVHSQSIYERTLASAIFSFCLSTHPQDPALTQKICAHLGKGPMLSQEFELYCKAMKPGDWQTMSSPDIERDWKVFCLNFIKRTVLAFRYNELLSVAENEAIKKCITTWFQEVEV